MIPLRLIVALSKKVLQSPQRMWVLAIAIILIALVVDLRITLSAFDANSAVHWGVLFQ